MKTWKYGWALALLAVGCGDPEASTSESFADAGLAIDGSVAAGHRYFEHRIDGCTSDGLVNCAPSIELCADGSGTVLVTDIANAVTYAQTDDRIEIQRVGPGDIPESLILELASDEAAGSDDWLEWQWQLVEAPAFSSCD